MNEAPKKSAALLSLLVGIILLVVGFAGPMACLPAGDASPFANLSETTMTLCFVGGLLGIGSFLGWAAN